MIVLEGLSKLFPSAEKAVLEGVDLRIRRGEFVAIIGPSGSGKSTLLNILGLLDRPTSGSYALDGQEVGNKSERERDRLRRDLIGFIFQSSNMLLEETVLANASMGLRVQQVPYRLRADRASRTLEGLGLGHRVDSRAKLLSGGEKQRCAIGRAIATDPPVLLADEPTGNLDSQNSARVIEILKDLHGAGKTVVVITHDPVVAAAAQRRIEIRDGHLFHGAEGAGSGTAGAGNVAVAGFDDRRVEVRKTPGAPASGGTDPLVATGSPSVQRRPGRRGVGFVDDVVEALSSVTGKPLRSLLLALSFALGVGGLVAATGMSQSASEQINARLLSSETSQLTVGYQDGPEMFPSESGDDGSGIGSAREPVQRVDAGSARGVQERLGAVEHVRSVGYAAMTAPSDVMVTRLGPWEPESAGDVALATASSQMMAQSGAKFFPAAAEHVLEQMDGGAGEGTAIVSVDAARSLHLIEGKEVPESVPEGLSIWANGRALQVVGFYQPGSGMGLYSNTVLVSPGWVGSMPGVQVQFSVLVEPGYAKAVEKAVPLVLEPGQPGRVVVQMPADLGSVRVGVAGDLGLFVGLFVGVLSGILLVLACLSAATAMYLSVQSRTGEIALRRAIGAGKWSVAGIFVTEGVLLGVIGGVVGALGGVVVTLALAGSQGWVAVLSPWYPVWGAGVGVVTGLVSAAYPAWAASRKNPADAMRT